MIIGIKLVKINPKTGKAYFPVCNIVTVISIDIDEFIKSYQVKFSATDTGRKIAVNEILETINKAFNCPLAWQGFDPKDAGRQTKEQLYYPETDSTSIDLTFQTISFPGAKPSLN